MYWSLDEHGSKAFDQILDALDSYNQNDPDEQYYYESLLMLLGMIIDFDLAKLHIPKLLKKAPYHPNPFDLEFLNKTRTKNIEWAIKNRQDYIDNHQIYVDHARMEIDYFKKELARREEFMKTCLYETYDEYVKKELWNKNEQADQEKETKTTEE
jgi:hypothetical protein